MVLSNNNNARQHNVLLSQSDFSQSQTNDYLLFIVIYLFYCSLSIAICLYATGSLNDVGRCSSVIGLQLNEKNRPLKPQVVRSNSSSQSVPVLVTLVVVVADQVTFICASIRRSPNNVIYFGHICRTYSSYRRLMRLLYG